MNQEFDKLIDENERLRRELDEAKEQLKKKQAVLDEWLKTYERWLITNMQLAPHAKVLEEELTKAKEQIAKLEAELKKTQLTDIKTRIPFQIEEDDLKGEDKASYESANPEICFEDFYDTEE